MNFRHFFRFLCLCMLTLLMQKTLFGRTSKLQHAKMHVFGNQKNGFFKVWDTLTMIQLRKKKHLTNVVSPLKTFFDHLQGRWENRKKTIFWKPHFFAVCWFLYCHNECKKWNFQKIDFFRFSQRPCKWSKNIFRGEPTLVRCFFFPQLNHG